MDDAVADRDGDPFEALDEGREQSAAEQSGREEPPEEFGEPFDSRDSSEPSRAAEGDGSDEPTTGFGRAEQDPSGSDSGAGPEPREPFEEMEFDVGRRDGESLPEDELLSDVGQRDGDPFDSFRDAFDEMDVDKLDPDVVWQELASAESRGSVGDAQSRTYAEVSKHSYCEQCPHFSPPPDVTCTHEGTEIVEFLDMETVRVVDCPVVTERENLEDDDGFGTG
nr:hypothetical protein [Halovenus carboxidivorans]